MGRTKPESHTYANEMRRAVINNNVAELRHLVAAGGDLNPPDIINRTLLHQAAARGAIQTAMALLDYGLDINARDKGGLTPLFTALRQGKTEMAIALLERGARMDIPNVHGALPFTEDDPSAQSRETGARVMEAMSLKRSSRLHRVAANKRRHTPGLRP